MNKNEMTINEIKAMYFDPAALTLPPVPLYRYTYKGDRFYYYLDPAAQQDYAAAAASGKATVRPPVKFAVGVTTLTRKTIPQPEQLLKWQAEQGWDEAIAYRDERALYGSLLHTLIATLLIKRTADLDTFAEVVRNYCKLHSIVTNEGIWVDDLKQDLLAFAQFVREYNVRALAIEMSLVSARLGVAGTLDLLCEMDLTEKGYFGEVYASGTQKGQPKETKRTSRTVAVVDFKSGRKSAGGLHNAAQLRLLRMLLDDNFPLYHQWQGVAVQLYNWNPKDWRTSPTYTLTDQTNSFSVAAAMNIISLYHELYPDVADKKTLEMFGLVQLDTSDLNSPDNYTATPIRQLVQQAVDEGTYGQTQYDLTESYFDTEQPADE